MKPAVLSHGRTPDFAASRVLLALAVFAFGGVADALAQPQWSLTNATAANRASAFTDDPNDPNPPCDISDLQGPFIPGFLGFDTGVQAFAGCGMTIATCPTAAVGFARVTVEGLGTADVTIKWRQYAWTYHNCDRDYVARSASQLLASLGLTPSNLPDGTQTNIYYSWSARSRNIFAPEAVIEDTGNVTGTELLLDGSDVLGGFFDLPGVVGFKFLNNQAGVRPGVYGQPFTVQINGRNDSSILPPPEGFTFPIDRGRSTFEGELKLSLLNPPPPPTPVTPPPRAEFSVDLGGDTELSDPNLSGRGVFDPGDAYPWFGPLLPPGGANGVKNDASLFVGLDPGPSPPALPGSGPPYCSGLPLAPLVPQYFNMDGFDTVDFSLIGLIPAGAPLANPISRFTSVCVFGAEHLVISFDDDEAGAYVGAPPLICTLPVFTFSAMAQQLYGTAQNQDEVLALDLLVGSPRYHVSGVTGLYSEARLHTSLAPDPLLNNHFDDDVDGLDILGDIQACNVWLFSVDHQATFTDPVNGALRPGVIYQHAPGGFAAAVIDPTIHMGLPLDVDIDAFELVWLYNPTVAGGSSLAIIFSVDVDDPLTPMDESGGLMPNMIYASYMTGSFFELLDFPLQDSIDAITAWHTPLTIVPPAPPPCPGDTNGDGIINGADLSVLLSQFGQSVPPGTGADFNGDGIVNGADLSVLLSNFGNTCP